MPLISVIFLILLESFIQNSLQHNTKLEASILSIVKADKVDKIDINSLTDLLGKKPLYFNLIPIKKG